MEGVQGEVAVITGATRGIGRQTALALGKAGATVVVVGRTRDAAPHPVLPGTLEGVVGELEALGVEARAIQADLTDGEATQGIVDQTLDWYGRCDVLINNAAFTSNGGILDVPWRRWERGFRAQVVAPLQLVQGFVPGMLERGAGHVINISTEAAVRLDLGVSLYSVSKQAMERLNDYLHHELGGRGVSFNVLRVDLGVTTETWKYVYETQGPEIATLGGTVTETTTPEQVAAQIEWMVRQPVSWSGNIVRCRDIAVHGGPDI
jgi:NAD(P)-dependent dehydrogenase (short-subunit alcohol dehydrogenase family)